MKTKKIMAVLLAVAALLGAAAWLAWQLIGDAMAAFAKGGVC
jgi:hypothetical protein